MIIKTSVGTFGSFQDIEHYMLQERMESIEIQFVDYWGIQVLSCGIYTLVQISFIVNEP